MTITYSIVDFESSGFIEGFIEANTDELFLFPKQIIYIERCLLEISSPKKLSLRKDLLL